MKTICIVVTISIPLISLFSYFHILKYKKEIEDYKKYKGPKFINFR